MQRVLAIILQLVISWPLLLPALSAGIVGSSTPECCRRNGAHHCVMQTGVMQTRAAQQQKLGARFSGVTAECPCAMHVAVANQTRLGSPSTGQAIFAGLLRHPALCVQTEAGYRVSFHRSRQKRGPPTLFFL
jgi:hypothetical protein